MSTLTGHVRSDIVVLSSVLNGQQADRLSLPRERKNDKLRLLHHISTVLTIGDDNSPVAHSVHAVSGSINVNAIKCLVCAENTGEEKTAPGVIPPVIPEAGMLEEVEGAGDSVRGAKLLEVWDQDIDNDLK